MLIVYSRSLRILREYFQTNVLHEQDPWESDEKAAELLKLLPDKELNDALEKKWENAPGRTSVNKWADIDALASAGASSTLDPKALLNAKQDIIFEYTYPRLDGEVTKKMNHLLKSPFCIHPKTGTVCVPIDVRTVEEFDPLGQPTVMGLLSEIDKWHEENPQGDTSSEGRKIPDWEKTSLKPYVEYFKAFVAGLLKDEKVVKRERTDGDTMEF
jgi:DNA primase small subunit